MGVQVSAAAASNSFILSFLARQVRSLNLLIIACKFWPTACQWLSDVWLKSANKSRGDCYYLHASLIYNYNYEYISLKRFLCLTSFSGRISIFAEKF